MPRAEAYGSSFVCYAEGGATEVYLASSPRPIFANFTERNAKIGPGIHCRGIGAHALVVMYNRQDIQNP